MGRGRSYLFIIAPFECSFPVACTVADPFPAAKPPCTLDKIFASHCATSEQLFAPNPRAPDAAFNEIIVTALAHSRLCCRAASALVRHPQVLAVVSGSGVRCAGWTLSTAAGPLRFVAFCDTCAAAVAGKQLVAPNAPPGQVRNYREYAEISVICRRFGYLNFLRYSWGSLMASEFAGDRNVPVSAFF